MRVRILVALVIAVASISGSSQLASAQTIHMGLFTITPDPPGSGSVTAIGNNVGGGFCYGPTGTAYVAVGGTFRAEVSPATGGCPGKLHDGPYVVAWVPGHAIDSDGWYHPNANPCPALHETRLGVMLVVEGRGSGNYRLENAAPGRSSVHPRRAVDCRIPAPG